MWTPELQLLQPQALRGTTDSAASRQATTSFRAEASGFQKTEVKVTLETNEIQGVNITLPLASTTQKGTVVSEAPPLDTDENRVQATLNAQSVTDLPELFRTPGLSCTWPLA